MKRVAIFAGSFDPFTIGHYDIYKQAEAIFGEGNVIVAIGNSTEKQNQGVDRIVKIQNALPSIEVAEYQGFLHGFIEKIEKEGYHVTLVRGLRNGDDLQYEQNQIAFIRDFKPDIKVMYILCEPQYAHVSSSAVRAIRELDEKAAEKYIAKEKY